MRALLSVSQVSEGGAGGHDRASLQEALEGTSSGVADFHPGPTLHPSCSTSFRRSASHHCSSSLGQSRGVGCGLWVMTIITDAVLLHYRSRGAEQQTYTDIQADRQADRSPTECEALQCICIHSGIGTMQARLRSKSKDQYLC